MPGSTTCRAMRSASMMGRLCGGRASRAETVDLPVAMEPVRPMTSMLSVLVFVLDACRRMACCMSSGM